MGTMDTGRKKNHRARLMERVTLGLWACEFEPGVGRRIDLKTKTKTNHCVQEMTWHLLGAGWFRIAGGSHLFSYPGQSKESAYCPISFINSSVEAFPKEGEKAPWRASFLHGVGAQCAL